MAEKTEDDRELRGSAGATNNGGRDHAEPDNAGTEQVSTVERALAEALESAQSDLDRARRKVKRHKAKAKDHRKKAKRAKKAADRSGRGLREARDRAEGAQAKAAKWKRRARGAENQVEVLRELNHQLTLDYRADRAAASTAMHFASEAVTAFASDALSLRELCDPGAHPEYLDHLTFRLRQNLIEVRGFLDEQGEVAAAANLADLLNELPADSTRRI